MGALMRAYDWDNHPLGSPGHWPDSLKANLRLMLNSGFPMFIWWSEELYMFHNDAYLPALGNKHPVALGARATDLWAEVWEDLRDAIDHILKGGNPFYADSLQLQLNRKGFLEETYWTFSYSPAFNDKGEVEGIFCACTEVTNTVLNERRLKSLKDVSEKMSQFQTLEQAAQLTCDILHQDKEDTPFSMIYLLNGAGTAATLLGKGGIAGDAVPSTIDLTVSGADWDLKAIQDSLQMSVIDIKEFRRGIGKELELPDGLQKIAVLPVMRPGKDHLLGFFITGISPKLVYNAEYSGFHSLVAGQIATAITSVQAREELAHQQEYLKEIFHQAPVGIAIVRGPQHIIDLANPGVCEIWGRKAEDVLGKPVIEALPEVSDQGIIQLLDNVIQTGEPFIANELPVLLQRKGELETVYLNFIYHPLRDSKGIISGLIAVAIDISEQVKYRQSIEALNEELLATNADLDNFVYSASHDLKAPISNIEGLMHALVEYLPEETLQSDTVKRVIELIQSSVDRFKRTVTDLTDVAKIQREAGDDVGSLNLASIIKEVQLDFEPEIAASDALVETELDPDAIIQFSAKNLRSIIYNLLSNALKYRSPDRRPVIKIITETKSDYVVLSVIDNGLGIEQENINKIFSMFKRMHDHVEGSGVGLYIVKRIIENAGGSIEVKSEVGQGSIFKIFFKR